MTADVTPDNEQDLGQLKNLAGFLDILVQIDLANKEPGN